MIELIGHASNLVPSSSVTQSLSLLAPRSSPLSHVQIPLSPFPLPKPKKKTSSRTTPHELHMRPMMMMMWTVFNMVRNVEVRQLVIQIVDVVARADERAAPPVVRLDWEEDGLAFDDLAVVVLALEFVVVMRMVVVIVVMVVYGVMVVRGVVMVVGMDMYLSVVSITP